MFGYNIIISTCTKEYDRLLPLFKDHWEEIGMGNTKHLTLDINLEYYKALEEAGSYFGVGIEETATGTLVGYISMLIGPHPHHRTQKFAVLDCFFLDKQHRTTLGKMAFYKAFTKAEHIAIEHYGCKYIQFVYSSNKDLSKLGERLGYSPSDVIMIKEVK